MKLETLLALRHRFDDLPAAAAERWEGRLETERDELAAVVAGEAEGTSTRRPKRSRRGGTRSAAGWWRPIPGSWWGPGLARTYRQGREEMSRALADPSTENVHRWRKRVKDHWYQLRILRQAWPGPLGETVAAAHELTELLGDHHDLAVLAADLRTRTGLGDTAPFEAAIERRQSELLDAAVAIGRRLYAEKPKAFRRRLERYWLAWRED